MSIDWLAPGDPMGGERPREPKAKRFRRISEVGAGSPSPPNVDRLKPYGDARLY